MRKLTRDITVITVFIIWGILLFINQKSGVMGPVNTIITWIFFVGAFLWIRFFTFGKEPDKKNITMYFFLTMTPYFMIAIAAAQVFYLMKRKGMEASLLTASIVFMLAACALMLVVVGVMDSVKKKRN